MVPKKRTKLAQQEKKRRCSVDEPFNAELTVFDRAIAMMATT